MSPADATRLGALARKELRELHAQREAARREATLADAEFLGGDAPALWEWPIRELDGWRTEDSDGYSGPHLADAL